MQKETERQIFHMIVGIGTLILLMQHSRTFVMVATFFTIIIGTLLINARLLGKKIFLVEWFERRFERSNAPLPGWGSACYAAGVLILLTFLPDIPRIAAGIWVVGMGDGISTMVGRRGKIEIPYNRNKTLEGTLAFFLSVLPAYYFIGIWAIPLGLIAAIVESLPLPIDDNLSIPIASAIFLLVAI